MVKNKYFSLFFNCSFLYAFALCMYNVYAKDYFIVKLKKSTQNIKKVETFINFNKTSKFVN